MALHLRIPGRGVPAGESVLGCLPSLVPLSWTVCPTRATVWAQQSSPYTHRATPSPGTFGWALQEAGDEANAREFMSLVYKVTFLMVQVVPKLNTWKCSITTRKIQEQCWEELLLGSSRWMGLVCWEPRERKGSGCVLLRSTTQPLSPAPRAAPAAPRQETLPLDPELQLSANVTQSSRSQTALRVAGVFIYNSFAGWTVCRKVWQFPRKGSELELSGRMRSCLLLVLYGKPKSFLKYFERHWHWLWCCWWVYTCGRETGDCSRTSAACTIDHISLRHSLSSRKSLTSWK